MTFHSVMGLALCIATLFSAQMTLGAPGPRWTLEEALEQAWVQNPQLQARHWLVKEVASDLIEARIYPHNPQLELEIGIRRSLESTASDYGFTISQELEIAGQRGKRLTLANQELAAAKAIRGRYQQLLALQVETAFAKAVRAREILTVSETDAVLAKDMLDFSKRRLDRGAATQIEVNLAQASAGRAERRLQRALADYATARSLVAEVVGVDPQVQPEPIGDLMPPTFEPPDIDGLLELARQNRADLGSIQHLEQAAESAIQVALAESRPNLTLGTFFRQEEGTDEILGATLGLSLPIFQRNQGQVARHRAKHQRLRYERDSLSLGIRQEVIGASNDFVAAQAAAEFLQHQVLGTLEENVELMQRSFAAGRIGITEVVTLRREFVATNLEYIEALADLWFARIALDRATGSPTAGRELK
ncbi:MAG: TolC family protein [Deltaproteobacteria bacterium]|nr:TolC family protein [Deltaproteobacteria bacterium]